MGTGCVFMRNNRLIFAVIGCLWLSGCAPEPPQARPWQHVPEQLLETHSPETRTGIPGIDAHAYLSAGGAVRASGPAFRFWLEDPASGAVAFPGADSVVSLWEGYLPIPKVRWSAPWGMEAEVELSALLEGREPAQRLEDSFFLVIVRLFNPGGGPRKVRLMVGGPKAGLEGDVVLAGGEPAMRLERVPDAHLESASATAFAFDLEVEGVSGSFAHAASVARLGFLMPAVPGSPLPARDEVEERYRRTRIYWLHGSGLEKPSFKVPHREYVDAYRRAVVTLLFDQSRGDDAALAAVALNRVGRFEEARKVLDRIEPENAGLHLFALADHFRFTGDEEIRSRVKESALRLEAGDCWAYHGLKCAAACEPSLLERAERLKEELLSSPPAKGEVALLWPEPLLHPLRNGTRVLFDEAQGFESVLPLIVMRDSARVLGRFEDLLAAQPIRGTYTWPGPDGIPSVRIAAGFVIAFRMLFIEEREGALLLAQCLPEPWVESGAPLGVAGMPTYQGPVSFTVQTDKRHSVINLETTAAPPKGIHLAPVLPSVEVVVEIDGRRVRADLDFERRQVLTLPPGTLLVRVDW